MWDWIRTEEQRDRAAAKRHHFNTHGRWEMTRPNYDTVRDEWFNTQPAAPGECRWCDEVRKREEARVAGVFRRDKERQAKLAADAAAAERVR